MLPPWYSGLRSVRFCGARLRCWTPRCWQLAKLASTPEPTDSHRRGHHRLPSMAALVEELSNRALDKALAATVVEDQPRTSKKQKRKA